MVLVVAPDFLASAELAIPREMSWFEAIKTRLSLSRFLHCQVRRDVLAAFARKMITLTEDAFVYLFCLNPLFRHGVEVVESFGHCATITIGLTGSGRSLLFFSHLHLYGRPLTGLDVITQPVQYPFDVLIRRW